MAKATVSLENFTPTEVEGLKDQLAIMLQCMRYLVGSPIYITSGVRQGDTGAHGRSLAVDISDNLEGEPISSGWRLRVLKAAFAVGFERVGDYDRHLHLDISLSLPQGVMWWGSSS